MLSNICKKDTSELYKTPILQQTAFWSIVKNKIGFHSIAINFKLNKSSLYSNILHDEHIHSDILVIIQQLNKTDCIAYVPYGPELEPENEFQGIFLEELSECLRSYLPSGCIMIRYDLRWEVYWASEFLTRNNDQENTYVPAIRNQEFRLNFNTVNWNLTKSYTNILPTNTLLLDLKPKIDTILERMKPKTRYNINLAHRKGVSVRTAAIEDIHIWYDLYQETARRNGILLNDLKYFKAILTAKSEKTKSPAEVYYLIAEIDNKPLAAMFLVISAYRASYLYGASSNEHRNYMPTYALQWEAIKIAKQKGCKEYDMFGISPKADPTHPMYGLYRYKMGFGGSIFESLGCWDYPLNHEKYNILKSIEFKNQGYHIN